MDTFWAVWSVADYLFQMAFLAVFLSDKLYRMFATRR